MQDLKELNETISAIKQEILDSAGTLTSSIGVYEFKKNFLDSKKGKISQLMKEMRNIPNEHKAEFGKTVNAAKNGALDFF